jgi:hypothetical protein
MIWGCPYFRKPPCGDTHCIWGVSFTHVEYIDGQQWYCNANLQETMFFNVNEETHQHHQNTSKTPFHHVFQCLNGEISYTYCLFWRFITIVSSKLILNCLRTAAFIRPNCFAFRCNLSDLRQSLHKSFLLISFDMSSQLVVWNIFYIFSYWK